MTREEQIMNAALEYGRIDEDAEVVDFVEGAKWADRTMIDKACEFLKNANAAKAIVIRKGVYNMKEFSAIEFTDNFIEQFKKAMEQ